MSRAGGAARVALLAAALAASPAAAAPPSLLPQGPAAAPGFRVTDVTGRTLELDALRRRGPVLLDFWATWCKPCLEEMPLLERWYTRYGPAGLTVIGVSVDGPRNFAKVRPFAERLGATYPIVLDPDERLRHLYQVTAMPTAVLVDRDGAVRLVRVGYRPGEGAQMEAAILSLVAPPGGTRPGATDSLAADTAAADSGRAH